MLFKNKLWFGLKVKNAQKKSTNLGYLNFQIFCILSFKFENSIKKTLNFVFLLQMES